MKLRTLNVALVCSLSIVGGAGQALAAEGQNAVDQALVASLQEGLPGLKPEEIRVLRQLVIEQEAARNNPTPPVVANKVNLLERGESPAITIMERFDTTLVFADRHGSPLEITAWRINDKQAATVMPLYSQADAGAAGASGDSGMIFPSEDGVAAASRGAPSAGAQEKGPVKALVLSPKAAMRSTNVTVMLEGQDYPLVLTVSTESSLNVGQEIAYIQELRLSWVSTMARAKELAGGFVGESGETSLDSRLLSLVQGIPDEGLEKVTLEGGLSTQLSLWRDATSESPVWYLRMAEHIEPWNVAVAHRTRDGLRGFTVMRLKGAPPKIMGFSANGQYSTVTLVD